MRALIRRIVDHILGCRPKQVARRRDLYGWSGTPQDNPEHDPGVRPAHRPGSFLDKRDRRGMGHPPTPPDPIGRSTDATSLGNIPNNNHKEN